MVQSIALRIKVELVRIDRKTHGYMSVGLLGRWQHLDLEEQAGGNRKIKVECLSKFEVALLGVQLRIALGIGGEITDAVTQLCPGIVDPYADLAKLAVPVFVGRIITQGVISRTILHALAHGVV